MNDPDLEADTGLGAMVAAAQPGDHAVLADWVEEHLRLDDLAAALRAGRDDPRKPAQAKESGFHGFRYRQLDRHVLLFAARFRVFSGYRAGKKLPAPEGHVFGLYLSQHAPRGPKRLLRWLPAEVKCEAFGRLWQELGEGRPADLWEEA